MLRSVATSPLQPTHKVRSSKRPAPSRARDRTRVSLGCPGEPRFEVWHSLVLHLSVEGEGDMPLFGERPRQNVVAMRSQGGVEVRDNVVRQYDGGKKPHCVAIPRRT